MNAQSTAMTKTTNNDTISRRFVDADRMFGRMTEVMKDIEQRAFGFFRDRNGGFGTPAR